MEKGSLSDKIAKILTAAPSHNDPEDENIDGTKASVNYLSSEGSDDEAPAESQIRRRNVDLLADIDERYAGQKGSRKSLLSDEEEGSSEDEILDDDNSESANESEEEDNEEYSGSESESDYNYEGEDLEQNEDESNFQTMSDVSAQVKKGRCVKNQMTIWESLLEMRIQVQKCLSAANKMPRPDIYSEIRNSSGPEFASSVQKTKNSISSVLEKLLLLQNLLWKQYPETKNLKSKQSTKEESDEDDDEDIAESEDEDEPIPEKRRKITELESDISNKHNLYKDYRNNVIQKWHDKTRLPAMKNNSTNHSIINHIEHTLADKAKLIKRTQLKRTEYKIVGEDAKEDSNEEMKEEYNTEIFDDNDFYHQLLRELIEVKSADLTDPVQLGRQWMQLQSLRSKMKRKIDTKATKGRKIRYVVHSKLVNFMAPMDNSSWSDEAKTELFGSLFGKNQTVHD
ncbi:unnamed protein product [Phyllotreta striolata]|uniref:Protein AATF n=1 Tax=Phyllotreta striolata TaxID=444603 RepID=A0A9N9TVJ7_PHYSR|nr:unnamed protein product [Phyllotreta striolata]